MKKLLAVRLGAIGDMLITTPIYELLKRDGWHITLLMKKWYRDTLRHCPFIDRYLWHDEGVPIEKVAEYIDKKGVDYDRVLNLSGSLETLFLISSDDPRFTASQADRDTHVNYYDHCLRLAGYTLERPKPILWLSKNEEAEIKARRKEYGNAFVIYWALSGSGRFKAWPFAEATGLGLLEKHDNITIVTNGDKMCQYLEGWKHPRAIHRAGKWTLRSSLLFTRVADLVIGPETGLMNAAGSNGVPKIVLLTHSRHENLTQYYDNVIPIQSEAPCSPCHRMMEEAEIPQFCSPDPQWGATACMMQIKPETVTAAVEQVLSQSAN